MDNKAVIYARVSSTGDRQSTARQEADLKMYAEASGMEIAAVYEDKASGANRGREQLAACRAFLLGGGAQHRAERTVPVLLGYAAMMYQSVKELSRHCLDEFEYRFQCHSSDLPLVISCKR